MSAYEPKKVDMKQLREAVQKVFAYKVPPAPEPEQNPTQHRRQRSHSSKELKSQTQSDSR